MKQSTTRIIALTGALGQRCRRREYMESQSGALVIDGSSSLASRQFRSNTIVARKPRPLDPARALGPLGFSCRA